MRSHSRNCCDAAKLHMDGMPWQISAAHYHLVCTVIDRRLKRQNVTDVYASDGMALECHHVRGGKLESLRHVLYALANDAAVLSRARTCTALQQWRARSSEAVISTESEYQ